MLPEILTGCIAAFFTAKFAVRQAFQDKWWTRKNEAYSEILYALSDAAQYTNAMREAHLSGPEFSPSISVKREEYQAAVWKLRRATYTGAFVISEKAVAALESLVDPTNEDWRTSDAGAIFDAQYQAYKTALDTVRKTACRELRKRLA